MNKQFCSRIEAVSRLYLRLSTIFHPTLGLKLIREQEVAMTLYQL